MIRLFIINSSKLFEETFKQISLQISLNGAFLERFIFKGGINNIVKVNFLNYVVLKKNIPSLLVPNKRQDKKYDYPEIRIYLGKMNIEDFLILIKVLNIIEESILIQKN